MSSEYVFRHAVVDVHATVLCNGRTEDTRVWEKQTIPPGGTLTFDLKPGPGGGPCERILTLEARLIEPEPMLPTGHVLGRNQFILSAAAPSRRRGHRSGEPQPRGRTTDLVV